MKHITNSRSGTLPEAGLNNQNNEFTNEDITETNLESQNYAPPTVKLTMNQKSEYLPSLTDDSFKNSILSKRSHSIVFLLSFHLFTFKIRCALTAHPASSSSTHLHFSKAFQNE